MNYDCVVTKFENERAYIDLKLAQKYDTLEDASLQVVVSSRDAVNQVTTTLAGAGKAVFDLKLGRFREMSIEALATSAVEDIKTHEKSTRKLTTKLDVKLLNGAPKPAEPEKKGVLASTWERAKVWSSTTMTRLAIFAAMIRSAFEQAIRRI